MERFPDHIKGLAITTLGVLVLTPDSLLVRLIAIDTWTMVFWRGVLMLVALVQVAIGIVLVSLALPPLLQVFHLWFSSLYIGVLLVLHFSLSHQEGIDHG